MKFAYIDVFLFGGIVLAGFLGYRSGVVRKILNLLVLVGATVLAGSMMTDVGGFFADAGILSEKVAYAVGFCLIVFVPLIATILLYRRFGAKGMVKSWSQITGMILGALEGLFLVGLVLIIFKIFDAPGEETRVKSMLYRPMVNFVPKSLDLLGKYLPGASDFKVEMSQAFKRPDLFESSPVAVPGKKR